MILRVGLLVLLLGCAPSVRHDARLVPVLSTAVEENVRPDAVPQVQRLLEGPLDVETAVEVALLNNRELRAVLREIGIARGHRREAGLVPNPRVEVEFLPERDTELELRIEYSLTGLILAPLRGRAERRFEDAARLELSGAAIALGYRVRAAFFALEAAEQSHAIAQRMLDGAAAARDAVRAMSESGNLSPRELSLQSVGYERMRIATAELELAAAIAREELLRLLGLHGESVDFAITELPPARLSTATPNEVETAALRASLELASSAARLEGLARRAGVTRTAGWLPEIEADVHGLNGDPRDEAAGARDWHFSGGVEVSVPLFDRDQGTTAALAAEFDAGLERYYGMAVEIRSAAREARDRVASALARAEHYESIILPAQHRLTSETLLQYNAMQLGIVELLAARRDELAIELEYIETLREYWTSVAERDALLAGWRVRREAAAVRELEFSEPRSRGGH